jgi:hypothetical protein
MKQFNCFCLMLPVMFFIDSWSSILLMEREVSFIIRWLGCWDKLTSVLDTTRSITG